MTFTLGSPAGIRAQFTSSAALRRLDAGAHSILQYPADELEAGPANLFLRLRGQRQVEFTPLLGPAAPSAVAWTPDGPAVSGRWRGLDYIVTFRLASGETAWFWHVAVHNGGSAPVEVDVVQAQDVALAPYSAVRTNEYYVSQYLDVSPVPTASAGVAVAVRQNMPGPAAPWLILGSLREGVGWGSDALQLVGRGHRPGAPLTGLSATDLPSTRLQHEHTLVLLQDRAAVLEPGDTLRTGFFARYLADHPAATSPDDARHATVALRQPEATPPDPLVPGAAKDVVGTLFATAPVLACANLSARDLDAFAGPGRRHPEWDGEALLSFFADDRSHVVLAAKQRAVLRPHGHILRTGDALVPDEGCLTSTAWMAGTFHSQVTQGHVSRNRLLSTRRGYLGLRRASGLRIFLERQGGWVLLDEPSAWALAPAACRWLYRHDAGTIEVTAAAAGSRHELSLAVRVRTGAPVRLLVCAHVALGGDDGADPDPPGLDVEDAGVTVRPSSGSATAERFPAGSFRLAWDLGAVEEVLRDGPLFTDGASRDLPYVALRTRPSYDHRITLTADLVPRTDRDATNLPRVAADPGGSIRLLPAGDGPAAAEVRRLDTVLPWFTHDALVHYLSPRGLEQYTGGAWGTRDVCQGPVGLLLALDRPRELRDLIVRVLRAQQERGDWPQAFEFWPRHAAPGQFDSHGDVVYWPLLALAEYLAATGDASLLHERLPFVGDDAATTQTAPEPVLDHVRRALDVIAASCVPGTALPRYGHGDWNDSLQPADPSLAARLCSTWTVTLHVHALRTLAAALRGMRVTAAEGIAAAAEESASRALEGMREHLLRDGVLTGYALFADGESSELLVHPSDRRTGLRYSLLPLVHALSGDLLSPAEAAEHLALVRQHLLGPDGARLFDRPPRYSGGPTEIFQRAEAATFFGREIGLMYVHAHLRYAEALARHGDAQLLLEALALANPVGMSERVASARRRQSTCYFSSSDALFSDRYEAAERYAALRRGEVALEGGWRVYSSGPGLFMRILLECFLGLRRRPDILEVDPVLAPGLDGLRAQVPLDGRAVEVSYRVGARGVGVHSVLVGGVGLPTTLLTNPYRPAGVSVRRDALRGALTGGGDIEIFVP